MGLTRDVLNATSLTNKVIEKKQRFIEVFGLFPNTVLVGKDEIERIEGFMLEQRPKGVKFTWLGMDIIEVTNKSYLEVVYIET